MCIRYAYAGLIEADAREIYDAKENYLARWFLEYPEKFDPEPKQN